MSVCSYCGAELDASAKFCMECGAPVHQIKKCIQCGIELPLKAKFCSGCGVPQKGGAATIGADINIGNKCAIQTKNEFIVDCNGQGDAAKVSEALQYAKDGATIIVHSGIYRDSFVVDKDITIYGEDSGKGLPVIWNDTEDNHFVMQINANAKISDLILQGAKTPFTIEFEYPERPEDKTPWEWWPRVVEINSSCTLKNINVCNSAGHGFAIAGDGAEPQIKECKSYDNRRMGFWIINRAKPIVTMCECYNNLIHGFCIIESAFTLIKSSKIYKNQNTGLWISNQGNVEIHQSKVYNCGVDGINVRDEKSSLVVNNCSVYEDKEDGICICDRGNIKIENCNIYKCGNNGVHIYNKGLGLIKCCNIYDNNQSIEAKRFNSRWEICISDEDSLANINGCKIGACCENKTDYGSGCSIEQGAKCIIENSKIQSNRSCAALSCEAASFDIKHSHLVGDGDEKCGIGADGIQIARGSDGKIEECSLVGKSNGLFIENSKVTISDSTIKSLSSCEGVQINAINPNDARTEEKSMVRFIGTTIENGIYTMGEFGDNEYEYLEEIRLENCILVNKNNFDYEREKLAGKFILINTSIEEK